MATVRKEKSLSSPTRRHGILAVRVIEITSFRIPVRPADGALPRSAAYFHDGNVDAVIECLPSCVSAGNPARYEPVTVGEHLAAKLAANLAGARGGQLNRYATREAARLRFA